MTLPEVGIGPDPDATPTATPWQEYLAAAQSLDAVLREAVASTAARPRVAAATQADLAQVRSRLEQQRARLVGEAVRAGLPAPPLVPTPAEQSAADAQVAGDPAAAATALGHCRQLLDAADAVLPAGPLPAGPLPAGPLPAGPVAPGPVNGPVPVVPVPPARPPSNPWWPPPLWLMIVVPVGAAGLLLCVLGLVLYLMR
jgi:hypothetical protein